MILSDGKNNSGHTGSGKDLWRSCRDAPEKSPLSPGAVGSMTYYFAGMDALLSEAFYTFHREHVASIPWIFAQVTDAEGGVPQSDNGMTYGSQVTTPDGLWRVNVSVMPFHASDVSVK